MTYNTHLCYMALLTNNSTPLTLVFDFPTGFWTKKKIKDELKILKKKKERKEIDK